MSIALEIRPVPISMKIRPKVQIWPFFGGLIAWVVPEVDDGLRVCTHVINLSPSVARILNWRADLKRQLFLFLI
jgi:hypothetical protein